MAKEAIAAYWNDLVKFLGSDGKPEPARVSANGALITVSEGNVDSSVTGTVSSTTVGTTLTAIGSAIDTSELDEIFVQFTTGAAINEFAINASADNGATYVTLYSAGDYDSADSEPKGILVGISGQLDVTNGAGWFFLRCASITSVLLKASVAAGSTTVSGIWSGK